MDNDVGSRETPINHRSWVRSIVAGLIALTALWLLSLLLFKVIFGVRYLYDSDGITAPFIAALFFTALPLIFGWITCFTLWVLPPHSFRTIGWRVRWPVANFVLLGLVASVTVGALTTFTIVTFSFSLWSFTAIPTVSDTAEMDSRQQQERMKDEIIGFSSLESLRAHRDELAIRRIDEPTFSGGFGRDYLMYAVAAELIDEEMAHWRSHPKSRQLTQADLSRLSSSGTPDWWFEWEEVDPIAVLEQAMPASGRRPQRIYANQDAGNFYIFYRWGH